MACCLSPGDGDCPHPASEVPLLLTLACGRGKTTQLGLGAVDPLVLRGTRLREEPGSVPQNLAPPPRHSPNMAEGGQGAAALLCPAARRAAASPAAAAAEAEPHRLRPPPFLWQPVRPAPTCPGAAAAAMRAASGEQPAAAAEEAGSRVRGEAAGGGQPCEARLTPGPAAGPASPLPTPPVSGLRSSARCPPARPPFPSDPPAATLLGRPSPPPAPRTPPPPGSG